MKRILAIFGLVLGALACSSRHNRPIIAVPCVDDAGAGDDQDRGDRGSGDDQACANPTPAPTPVPPRV